MRYDNIQLLRFVAALGVVLYHLGVYGENIFKADRAALWPLHPLIVAGFPVPLFFAVSGFVLTQSLNASAAAQPSARAGRFLFARLLRLYPGYWLAVLAVVVLMRLRVYTEHDRWLIYFVNFTELTLWPAGPGQCPYLLSVEWSLIYEVFLSVALAGLSLLGLRRGLPIAALVWLGVIAVKMAVRPGYGTATLSHWSTIALSAYVTPFLLGVLVFHLKDRGRRWRWVVLACAGVLLTVTPQHLTTMELHWCNWGVAAACVVWLAVQFRQVSPTNRVAKLGDYSYGLFLLHAPLMLAVFHISMRLGLTGRLEVVWAAGVVAVAGGLLFGRVESKLHARIRPLAKAKRPSLRLRLRLRSRTPR